MCLVLTWPEIGPRSGASRRGGLARAAMGCAGEDVLWKVGGRRGLCDVLCCVIFGVLWDVDCAVLCGAGDLCCYV